MSLTNTQKLGSAFSNFSARYAPAVITLLILSAGFYFYFNVVVSGNESDLKERNFRGLHRMATNISGKVESYVGQNAANFLTGLNSPNQADRKAGYDLGYSVIPNIADTLQFFVRYSEGWNLMFKPKKSAPILRDTIAYASAKKFVASLLRRDLFPYYLLAVGDTILFDELNISHQRMSTFLTGDYAKDSFDKEQIRSGEIREVSIGGNEYKLFILSFIVEGKSEFKIGGYMHVETYVKEQRYIPTYAFLWLLIGIILVLLMFPLLKIFLMQRSEQMLVSNSIAPFASLHVIGAIVVLVAINSYVHFNLVLLPASSDLKTLADNTQSIFVNELDAAMVEMDSAKAAVKKDTGLLKDWKFPLQVPRVSFKDSTDNTIKSRDSVPRYKPGEIYPYFKHLVWTDTAGQQQYRWTTNPYLSKNISVRDRDYFKAVDSENLWLRDGKPYYFTVISSWVASEKLAVISRPFSKEDSLLTARGLMMQSLSGSFRSMFNALLPTGYGFCLVTANGDVIFHHDENRSLNENLIEECTDKETLKALLKTRSSGFAESRYSGSSKRFYVKAIPGMPYSVVSFRDLRTMWSEGLDVISSCSILCLMNLAVILFAILIIQASGYKHSLLHSQFILVGWLRPNKKRRKAYCSVTIFYLYSMVLQAVFFLFYRGSDPLWLVGVSFSFSFISISNSYRHYAVLNEDDDGKKEQSKTPLLFLRAAYLFSAVIFMLNLKSGQWMFFISQISLLLVPLLFAKFNLSDKILKNHLVQEKGFRWWYALSVFSFVAATSITPLINFYLLTFKEERLLTLKQNQLDFANQFMQEPSDPFATTTDSIRFSYNAPYHFQNFADKITRLAKMPPSNDTVENSFEALYKKIKPAFSDHSREIEFLIKRKDTTRDFYWQYNPDSRGLTLLYSTPKTQAYFSASGIAIQSNLKSEFEDTQKAIKDDWLSLLLLFGGLILSLWGFVHLLNRLIERIFFKGYDASSQRIESDLPFINSLPKDENIFINGAVNSGKSKLLKTFLSKNSKEFYEIDLAGLSAKEPDGALGAKNDKELMTLYPDSDRIIIIRHLELFMNDLAMTEKKLILFESLLRLKRQLVVLSSRSFDSMAIRTPDKALIPIDYTDRWSNVMNQFYNLYHRWLPDATGEKDIELKTIRKETRNKMFIAGKKCIDNMDKAGESIFSKMIKAVKAFVFKNFSWGSRALSNEEVYGKTIMYFKRQLLQFLSKLDKECAHSDFLWDLRPAVITYLDKNAKEFMNFDFQSGKASHQNKVIARHFILLYEKICLKIQSLSANYYMAVWQSLNLDEQRTLYDIALDEIANPANRDIASRLVDLGLAKRVPDIACYQAMNTSFRNFIFTQLDKKEVSNLQADASGKGSWNSFQLPILMVVIGIGIFLFTTQKDAFTNMITYLGAAAGGIAALLRVMALIPSNKT
ncbi:MAG: hypothetical protein JWR72_2935 [Flavisolibacter sp.]|nr:hypothetical protein [Flavisolibacter sp.]